MSLPTVGRVLVVHALVLHRKCRLCAPDEVARLAAITHVWEDRRVNLVVFDSNGAAHGRINVNLLQDDDARPDIGHFCERMAYQLGQGAKAAASPA